MYCVLFNFTRLHYPDSHEKETPCFPVFCLFLLGKLGGTNVAAAELDVEDTLHVGEDLLVGGGGTTLKVGNDGLGGVALGGEVLLGHLGLHLLTGLGDDVADALADGVGLDNVVGSVDLGETLAFAGAALERKVSRR